MVQSGKIGNEEMAWGSSRASKWFWSLGERDDSLFQKQVRKRHFHQKNGQIGRLSSIVELPWYFCRGGCKNEHEFASMKPSSCSFATKKSDTSTIFSQFKAIPTWYGYGKVIKILNAHLLCTPWKSISTGKKWKSSFVNESRRLLHSTVDSTAGYTG